MIKFCGLDLAAPFFLAPMAGVTDSPFRTVCAEAGAALTYTEMISAKALVYRDKKTMNLMRLWDDPAPGVVQLFGSEPDIMGEAAAIAAEITGTPMIDINMGCPVPKVAGHGEGSALMGDVPRAEAIIRAVKQNSPVPVTVKFRAGLNDASINAVEFAKMAEAAGADAVTVHGRTREQMYRGRSDRTIIAKVKQAVDLPVIASGDALSGPDCMDILRETGADAVMIARGAQGNPMIFADCLALWLGKPLPEHTPEEIVALMRRQAELCVQRKGESAMVELRKHGLWYLDRFRSGRRLKPEMSMISTLAQFHSICDQILEQGFCCKKGDGAL